jgi:hypothetical protein
MDWPSILNEANYDAAMHQVSEIHEEPVMQQGRKRIINYQFGKV